jgi:catechol 2,3-dioxygenase-like lactoylglutathione lyase family enzyme
LKFYEEFFGLREVERGDNSQFGNGVFVLLRDRKSGMKLELNWYPASSRYSTPYVVGEGLDHIAFCVDNIKEKFKELVDKGVSPTDFGPKTGANYCYLKDPDGNWIEIYQRKEPIGETVPEGY